MERGKRMSEENANKLVLELANQKPPPDPIEEFKKKAKAWLKKHVLMPAGAAGLTVTGGVVGYQMAEGGIEVELNDVVSVAVLVTCAVALYLISKKPKGK